MMTPWMIAVAWKWAIGALILLVLTVWLAAGWCGIVKKQQQRGKRKLSQEDQEQLEWLKRMSNKMKE